MAEYVILWEGIGDTKNESDEQEKFLLFYPNRIRFTNDLGMEEVQSTFAYCVVGLIVFCGGGRREMEVA